jgi:hypothetical protein
VEGTDFTIKVAIDNQRFCSAKIVVITAEATKQIPIR